MKTISIKELHAETGRWVRAAKKQTIIVTDRGEKIATIQAHSDEGQPMMVFARRKRGYRPSSPVDSTTYISEERDAR